MELQVLLRVRRNVACGVKPLEAEGLAVGVVERRKPEIKWRRTKTVLSPKTLKTNGHRGDFRFHGVAVKMARVSMFSAVSRSAGVRASCSEVPECGWRAPRAEPRSARKSSECSPMWFLN